MRILPLLSKFPESIRSNDNGNSNDDKYIFSSSRPRAKNFTCITLFNSYNNLVSYNNYLHFIYDKTALDD